MTRGKRSLHMSIECKNVEKLNVLKNTNNPEENSKDYDSYTLW